MVIVTNLSAQPKEIKGDILFLIAPKEFRDEEILVPYDYLKKAGFKPLIASADTTEALGILGAKIKPDISLKEIDTLKLTGMVLVGGPGSVIYWDDSLVHTYSRHFFKNKKLLAAICLAPVTLARAKVLTNRSATVFRDRATISEFKKYGVKYQDKDVVIDGLIVTASGPKASEKFAKAIEKVLLKQGQDIR